MGEEIAVENGRISDIQGLVTLTLDRVILHTGMRHSSTSTTYQISSKSKKHSMDGRRTDVQTGIQMYGWADGHLRPTLLGQLGGVDLKIYNT